MSCITKIVLTRSSYAVKRGEWVWNPLSAVLPSSAACNTIIWSSSNTCVVAINRSSGAFHGLSAGEATITASAADGSGVTARATVSVRDKIYVSSVTLNRSSLSLNVGKSATLTASVKPTNADNKNLKWTSGNPCVAKVSSDGKVTAVSTGRAQITAETTDCSGCSADCFVTVTENKLVTDLQIRPSSAYTVVDSSAVLTPYITPSDATNRGLKWWSENTKIATVSGGNVIGISPGDVKIYAETTDGTAIRSYATVHVRQRVPVESVEIVDTPDIVRIGSCDGWAYACVKPTNATNQRVFWSSDREEIIDVTYNTGHLDARLPGKATITAMTYDGKFTDSKTLRSVYDKVIIEKGEDITVKFVESNKIWYYVGADLIYDTLPAPKNQYFIEASQKNLYKKYVAGDIYETDGEIREYTDGELRLLYAVDPFGVAAYIRDYTSRLKSYSEVIKYKDSKFELLFGRKPRYYKRRADGNFYEVSEVDDINDVLSESEALFGAHPIWDGYTAYALFKFAKAVLGFIPEIGTYASIILDVAEFVAKVVYISYKSQELGIPALKELGDVFKDSFGTFAVDSIALKDFVNDNGTFSTEFETYGTVSSIFALYDSLATFRSAFPAIFVMCSSNLQYQLDSAQYDIYYKKGDKILSAKNIYNIINDIK